MFFKAKIMINTRDSSW